MMDRGVRFAISGAVLLADRGTKYWIEQNLSAFDTIVVIPHVFNIVHAQNRGAAFGFLNDSSGAIRNFILIGVSSLILAYIALQLWQMPKRMWPEGYWPSLGLALVFGGAVGNLFDRVWRGSVTDFLQVFIGSYEWPSFNVADSAISVGAGVLLIALWRSSARTVPGTQ